MDFVEEFIPSSFQDKCPDIANSRPRCEAASMELTVIATDIAKQVFQRHSMRLLENDAYFPA